MQKESNEMGKPLSNFLSKTNIMQDGLYEVSQTFFYVDNQE